MQLGTILQQIIESPKDGLYLFGPVEGNTRLTSLRTCVIGTKQGLEHFRLFGVESLLRWQRPGQGLVSPGEFIPLAESTGLILPIGEWALRAACEQAVAWKNQGLPSILMMVNISPQQFHQPGLAEQVKRTLLETGWTPISSKSRSPRAPL